MLINNLIDLSVKPSFQMVMTDEQLAIFKDLDEEFTYNSQIVDGIIEKYNLNLGFAEKDTLGTYVYIARHQLADMRKEQATNEMLAQGWQKLTPDVAKELNGKKIKVNAKRDYDWLSMKIDEVYKVKIDAEDNVWLMKPNARTRGYRLAGFENPLYQLA